MGAFELRSPNRRAAPQSTDRIVAVVGDASSEEVVKNLMLDQGIAHAFVARGHIGDAIELMRGIGHSPRHLLVDVSDSSMPVSDLMRLAEVVDPSVNVVVVGDRNDVGLFRSLLRMGVEDYLVKPLTVELVQRALTAQLVGDRRGQGPDVELDDVDFRFELGLTQLVHERAATRVPVRRRLVADEGPDALPSFDQAGVGKVGQRPSHGDPRDTELVAQRLFGRQRITGRQCAPGDLVVQHQEQLSVQRHPGTSRHLGGGPKVVDAHQSSQHRADTPRFLRLKCSCYIRITSIHLRS